MAETQTQRVGQASTVVLTRAQLVGYSIHPTQLVRFSPGQFGQKKTDLKGVMPYAHLPLVQHLDPGGA